jgi:hypothetical protein
MRQSKAVMTQQTRLDDGASLMTRWERLSEADIARIDGGRARLVACLVDLYGWSPQEAESEVASFERDAADITAAKPHGDDAVAQASDDSFPASDPPGWIRQAPRAPQHASAPPQHGAEQPQPAAAKKRRRKRS